MAHPLATVIAAAGISLLGVAAQAATAASEELGNGFRHHGVATPVSNHRGTVATVDGDGRNVVLVWLFDQRGSYALLLIDAETGKSEEFAMPFPPGGDCPYASILSSRNRFYTHFNSHFVEFDPVKRAFTFFGKTAPQMAMGMTEDDNGVIWSVTYPNSGVVSFNPATGELKDYGHVYAQPWAQYQRSVAADDAGWIYFGVGNTASQIIAFDPGTGKATPLLAEEERGRGTATVYRDLDGKVYGQALSGSEEWIELYRGQARKIGKREQRQLKPIITNDQGLFHREFPDGKRVRTCDLVERRLVVEDPQTGQAKEVRFDYTSEGAHIMGLAAAPDGTICGGTAFPMRFFSYNPETDSWTNRESYGQWNTVARQGDRFFVGGYGGGFLLEWDPARPWVATEKEKEGCNPLHLAEVAPAINRPHELLAHPDGKTVVLAGTPGYGYTGGGLLFWDRETRKQTLIEHTEILPDHSTMSLVALPGGKLLGGTTTQPGTGGEKKANEAELYVMDLATHRVEWHQAVFPGAQDYTDLYRAPSGLIYGFADRTRFFVFDAETRKVVHEADTGAEFGPCVSHQGPRVFVPGRGNTLYVLFVKGIARVEPRTHRLTLLAESPVPISAGGDFLNGRIYFASGSHVYSYQVP
ncbi:MAG: hypothetical protein GX774_11675 [Armatimonadetes bacterium]|nr:hypothetical protein [Armatimonadota bacterium]